MEVDRIISDAFLAAHPAEAARVIARHSVTEAADFLSECAPEPLGPVVAAMDPGAAAAALGELAVDHAAQILDGLPSAAAAALLLRLAPEPRDAILERMSPATAGRVRARLRYPPGTAGALMDPVFMSAGPAQSVAETMDGLRRAGAAGQSCLFVTGHEGVLAGVVEFGVLLRAEPETPLAAVARREYTAIPAGTERGTLLAHPAWADLLTPPVVDEAGRLVGVLRYSAVRGQPADGAPPTRVAAAALELTELAWLAGAAVLEALADACVPPSQPAPEAAG